jgi:Fe-S-cluster containining protein
MPDTISSPDAARDDLVARAASRVVPGRACGTCTLCCKVIAVTDFNKLPGVWCPHCIRGKGCGIYETRPTDCRTFFCEWMLEKGLGPEWKPERAKFALVMGEGGHLTAFVDPGFPAAWRNAPYIEAFRKLAAERAITIRTGTKVIVVLPDREIDLGHVGPDESVRFEPGPDGRIVARKVPRAQA